VPAVIKQRCTDSRAALLCCSGLWFSRPCALSFSVSRPCRGWTAWVLGSLSDAEGAEDQVEDSSVVVARSSHRATKCLVESSRSISWELVRGSRAVGRDQQGRSANRDQALMTHICQESSLSLHPHLSPNVPQDFGAKSGMPSPVSRCSDSTQTEN